MYLIFKIIGFLGAWITPIWAIVEFILYLVKDREFNWWSVWLFLVSIVFILVALALETGTILKRKSKNNTPFGKM